MEELHLTYFKMCPQKEKKMSTNKSSILRTDLLFNIKKSDRSRAWGEGVQGPTKKEKKKKKRRGRRISHVVEKK